MSDLNAGRLVDVFLFGPLQIIVGIQVKNIVLKLFMILTGVMNILFNGHNYLYFDNRIDKVPVLKPFVNDTQGKFQAHRLYNLLVMYPIFLYVYATTPLPKWLASLFLLNIVIGFGFNFYFYATL